MGNNEKVLSVVCARAGSKGLKNKCLYEINGKPLIEYSIDFSLSLEPSVHTVVSTDIAQVIEYCRRKGIDHIDRSKDLCSDGSRIEGVLADAVEKKGAGFKYVSLLYGNIPTRYPELYREAAEFLFKNQDYDVALSMQNVEKFNPAWMFDYNPDLLPRVKQLDYRRQELPQKMIPDGHTFICKAAEFYKRYKGTVLYDKGYFYAVFGEKIKPVLNNKLIIDIDTEKDLKLAEAVFCCGDKTLIR